MKAHAYSLAMHTQVAKITLWLLSILLLCYVNLARADTIRDPHSIATITSSSANASDNSLAKADNQSLYQAENLPNIALTKEIFYKVLASELAVKRGYWQSAYLTLLGLARQTGDPRFCQRATEIALSFHRSDEALGATRFWLSLAPTSELAHHYWYAILISKNQTEELARHFSQLLKISSPEQFNALVFQAQHVFMTAKNKQASYVILKKLFAPYISIATNKTTQNDRVAPYIALANASYTLDLIEESKVYAERALALDPDSELALLSLVQTLSNEAALLQLAQFIQVHPHSKEVRLAYANFLIDEQKFDLAVIELEELNQRYPQHIHFIYSLANLHFKLGHDEVAQTGYLAFLNLAKQEPEIDRIPSLLRLTNLALKQHDYAQAQIWFSQIPDLKEKHTHYLAWQIQHALLLTAMDETESALELLEETICQDGAQKIQVVLTQSQILKTKQQLQQAYQLLQVAKAAYPKSHLILTEYASIAELLSTSKERARQTLVNH